MHFSSRAFRLMPIVYNAMCSCAPSLFSSGRRLAEICDLPPNLPWSQSHQLLAFYNQSHHHQKCHHSHHMSTKFAIIIFICDRDRVSRPGDNTRYYDSARQAAKTRSTWLIVVIWWGIGLLCSFFHIRPKAGSSHFLGGGTFVSPGNHTHALPHIFHLGEATFPL